jgi:hypothetical protein
MHDAPEPDLTPDQRLLQVAALLARGVRLYLRLRHQTTSSPAPNTPENPANCLEVPVRPWLSVSRRIGV